MADEFSTYLAAIGEALAAKDATEHTHRPALKSLLEALRPDLTATNEPRRIACGAPDYAVSASTPHGPLRVGYVEAKDVGAPLQALQESAQLLRYRGALSAPSPG